MAGTGIPNLSLASLMGQADASQESEQMMKSVMSLSLSEAKKYEQMAKSALGQSSSTDISKVNEDLEAKIAAVKKQSEELSGLLTQYTLETGGIDVQKLLNSGSTGMNVGIGK